LGEYPSLSILLVQVREWVVKTGMRCVRILRQGPDPDERLRLTIRYRFGR
jgi:hypothetical protein